MGEVMLERDLIAPGGTIVCDNVLYNGYPYVPDHFDSQPARRGFGNDIRDFNRFVYEHPELEQVVLPIRDGVSILRKKSAVPQAVPVAPQAKASDVPVQPSAACEKKMATTQLEHLRTMTSIVADTGDFDAIKAFAPEDCTTNPSLLLAAAKMPKFLADLEQAAKEAKAETGTDDVEALVSEVCDRFAVKVGLRLLELLPKEGRVSTEVDAELSFDTDATIAKAHQLIKLYAAHGISKDRILIKLASTWESIQACKVLEEQGIKCNMTLLFSFAQAVACAEAGATLISPFVGRILDWYKKNTDKKEYTPDEDPGVQSVRRIYRYYKKFGHQTIVMGASFRNTGQIIGLAGCDKLTVAPKLLDELSKSNVHFDQVLSSTDVVCEDAKMSFDEKSFRFSLNQDAMATEKLAEGLRGFVTDGRKLREFVKETLQLPKA